MICLCLNQCHTLYNGGKLQFCLVFCLQGLSLLGFDSPESMFNILGISSRKDFKPVVVLKVLQTDASYLIFILRFTIFYVINK